MGPMLRLSPRLMLRPTTMVDMAWEPTAAMDSVPMATDTVLMATATPPTPDMDTTTARGPLMLRLSPRLMLRPTTMVLMAMALTDTMPMEPTHTPTDATTTKLLILDLFEKKLYPYQKLLIIARREFWILHSLNARPLVKWVAPSHHRSFNDCAATFTNKFQ